MIIESLWSGVCTLGIPQWREHRGGRHPGREFQLQQQFSRNLYHYCQHLAGGQQSIFATSPLIGLDTVLGVLWRGFVIVGIGRLGTHPLRGFQHWNQMLFADSLRAAHLPLCSTGFM